MNAITTIKNRFWKLHGLRHGTSDTSASHPFVRVGSSPRRGKGACSLARYDRRSYQDISHTPA